MACTTCKKSKQETVFSDLNEIKQPTPKETTVKDYILKAVLFCVLLVVLTPLILILFVITLFKLVVLSKEINLLPLVYFFSKKIFEEKDNDDDDDDDDEEPVEGEHELADPDEIIEIKS